KTLFLCAGDPALIRWLTSFGETVIPTRTAIDLDFVTHHAPDFIVSYGYRFLIRRDMLAVYPGRAVNLQPWNSGAARTFGVPRTRGADPAEFAPAVDSTVWSHGPRVAPDETKVH